MLFLAVGISLIATVLKERFDPSVSVNDIVSDILGIFFGTAFIAGIFMMGGKHLSKEGSLAGKRVSLRALLTVGVGIEEQAKLFYEKAALRMTDPSAKEICLKVAAEEEAHRTLIKALLERWLPRSVRPNFATWTVEELARLDIFTLVPLSGSSTGEILEYAIRQERKMAEFYEGFKGVFPQEWKRRYVRYLIAQERAHEATLVNFLNQFA